MPVPRKGKAKFTKERVMFHVLNTAYSHAAELRRVGLDLGKRWPGQQFGPLEDRRKGLGSDYAEARPYVVGDDVRRLDYHVTQRTGEYHVRDTIAERELEVWFVVKHTRGMNFGSSYATKYELVRGLVAAIGLMLQPFAARFGLIVAGGHILHVVEASGSPDQLHVIDTHLERHETDNHSSMAEAFGLASDMIGKRALVVPMTDMLEEDWKESPLRLAHGQRVIEAEIIDDAEMTLPFAGVRRLDGSDNGRSTWTWITPTRRRSYQAAAKIQRENHADTLKSKGIVHVQIYNRPDWPTQLIRETQTNLQERRWSA